MGREMENVKGRTSADPLREQNVRVRLLTASAAVGRELCAAPLPARGSRTSPSPRSFLRRASPRWRSSRNTHLRVLWEIKSRNVQIT
ncbi:T-complex protein 1 subunit [Musa troglodytarum]|uniref:T-complex protein 1 subunit n=1 Tax=Musa troglodytarum TaxID=320322 RepID=A0A9E7GX18_9LILI|nr:T-complex protein 1 subunit [Musa troglodytarum]